MGKDAWSILPLFVYEPLSAKQVKMAEFIHQGRAQYKNILAIFIFLARLIRIFEINLEDTFARCEKYSSQLDIISLAYSYLLIKYFRSLKKILK